MDWTPQMMSWMMKMQKHISDRLQYRTSYNLCCFSWSVADEAYEKMKDLAQKHGVGFYDVSGDDGIILP